MQKAYADSVLGMCTDRHVHASSWAWADDKIYVINVESKNSGVPKQAGNWFKIDEAFLIDTDL